MTSSIVQEAPTLRYGWQTKRLADIAPDANALADGPFGSKLKTEHYALEGARVIRLQNIGIGDFLDRNKAFISLEHFATLTRHDARPGDVVVAALGDGARPAGRACIVPEGIGPAIVKADCFRVRLPAEVVAPEFLSAFLNSPQALATASDQMRGATRSRFTLEMLRNLRTPISPIREQHRIAERLKEQMAHVARARAAANAQSLAIGSFLESALRVAFHNSTPLSTGSSITTPPGWRWHRLLDLARLESGHTPGRKRPEWWGGEVPWLAPPDIRRLDCREAHETLERTNADGLANSSARMLPPGTVCLSRTASVGFVTILGREMATSQDFVNWICGPELDP